MRYAISSSVKAPMQVDSPLCTQAVKNAIETPYSRSDIRADGQVVKIAFSDGMKFEVLPAFPQTSLGGSVSHKYPDTNMGGNWRTTDPKSEQKAMKEKNRLLRRTRLIPFCLMELISE